MDLDEPRIFARPATEEDDTFLRDLFFEIRSPEFAPANLSIGQLRMLMDGQYEARRMYYANVFPAAAYSVLESDGTAVGSDIVEDGPELHLIDIALLGRFQNRGLGTARMRQLMSLALAGGKPMILSVEAFSPAQRLYERLGFRTFEEAGIYKRMSWGKAAD